ncbi:ELAV-like protein 1 [Paramacrobiotus metropolitanus]|uniref:ELAV-like protein 1 n=1 Tax=Paramacrobiotus metropolitanus TaxID=2943436 RepID=UPI0024457132|nr:ELAV-like protein 1 [Paramacrobiotus metropolitanus]
MMSSEADVASVSEHTEEVTADVDPCKLVVNYLPSGVKENFLRMIFGTEKILEGHARLEECKVVRRKTPGGSVSRGYAFLKYSHEDAAKRAVKLLNGFILLNSGSPQDVDAAGERKVKRLKVSYCRPADEEYKNTNLFITGIPCKWQLEDLKEHFGRWGGKIITCKMAPRNCRCNNATDGDDQSNVPSVPCDKTDWAFVRFTCHKDADTAQRQWHMRPPLPGWERVLKVKILDDDKAGLRYLGLR